jgi:preprotein translocase subunit SecA
MARATRSDLMRLFMSERVAGAMEKWGVQEGEVITHRLVTRSIGQAQKRVEGNNFEARKRLLDYDDVMNQQREVIYDLRLFALEGGEDLKGEIWEMIEHSVRDLVEEYCPSDEPAERWDPAGLRRRLLLDLFLMADGLPEENPEDPELTDSEAVAEMILESARHHFHRKIADFGELGERVMSFVMLTTLDDKWKDHLYDLDHLKASISFRGWGQKDPLIEYKKDAYEMFVDLMTDIRRTVTSSFFRAQVGVPQQRRMPVPQRLSYSGPTEVPSQRFGAPEAVGAPARRGGPPAGAAAGGVDELGIARAAGARAGGVPAGASGPDPRELLTNRGEARKQAPVTAADEPGRNDPCPCGSGKKYKKCHGRNA